MPTGGTTSGKVRTLKGNVSGSSPLLDLEGRCTMPGRRHGDGVKRSASLEVEQGARPRNVVFRRPNLPRRRAARRHRRPPSLALEGGASLYPVAVPPTRHRAPTSEVEQGARPLNVASRRPNLSPTSCRLVGIVVQPSPPSRGHFRGRPPEYLPSITSPYRRQVPILLGQLWDSDVFHRRPRCLASPRRCRRRRRRRHRPTRSSRGLDRNVVSRRAHLPRRRAARRHRRPPSLALEGGASLYAVAVPPTRHRAPAFEVEQGARPRNVVFRRPNLPRRRAARRHRRPPSLALEGGASLYPVAVPPTRHRAPTSEVEQGARPLNVASRRPNLSPTSCRLVGIVVQPSPPSRGHFRGRPPEYLPSITSPYRRQVPILLGQLWDSDVFHRRPRCLASPRRCRRRRRRRHRPTRSSRGLDRNVVSRRAHLPRRRAARRHRRPPSLALEGGASLYAVAVPPTRHRAPAFEVEQGARPRNVVFRRPNLPRRRAARRHRRPPSLALEGGASLYPVAVPPTRHRAPTSEVEQGARPLNVASRRPNLSPTSCRLVGIVVQPSPPSRGHFRGRPPEYLPSITSPYRRQVPILLGQLWDSDVFHRRPRCLASPRRCRRRHRPTRSSRGLDRNVVSRRAHLPRRRAARRHRRPPSLALEGGASLYAVAVPPTRHRAPTSEVEQGARPLNVASRRPNLSPTSCRLVGIVVQPSPPSRGQFRGRPPEDLQSITSPYRRQVPILLGQLWDSNFFSTFLPTEPSRPCCRHRRRLGSRRADLTPTACRRVVYAGHAGQLSTPRGGPCTTSVVASSRGRATDDRLAQLPPIPDN